MTTTNFTTTILVDNTTSEVFNAINNVRSWWQGEIIGDTDKLGDEFSYQMKDVHFSKQKIIECIANQKIVWLITESILKHPNQTEWTNTKIVFDITEVNNKTQVQFTHVGLVPTFECYVGCSWAWGQLIQESLHSLIPKEKGTNVFG